MLHPLIKPTLHRTRMHRTHINPQIPHLDMQTRRHLRHKRFGSPVGGSKGAGYGGGYGGGVDDAAGVGFLDEEGGEVVGYGEGGGGVAFDVGEEGGEGGLVHEAGYDEAGVGEDDFDVDVFGGVFDGLEVRDSGAECHTNATEFQFGVGSFDLLHSRFEKIIID